MSTSVRATLRDVFGIVRTVAECRGPVNRATANTRFLRVYQSHHGLLRIDRSRSTSWVGTISCHRYDQTEPHRIMACVILLTVRLGIVLPNSC
jgi:hypothetical protein